jgi:hypothetical protein
MPPKPQGRPPRWYAIPVRVLLDDVHRHADLIRRQPAAGHRRDRGRVSSCAASIADMTVAYRHVALPFAAVVAGSIIFVLALAMEIRHYRQTKTLAAIARVS